MAKPDLSSYGGKLLDVGYPGQVADMQDTEIESRSLEGVGASIDFGLAIARGTADDTCKVIAADGDLPIGITVRHPIRPADASGDVKYNRYDSVPIMRRGNIFVTAFENTVRGDGAISVTAQGGKIGSTTGGAAGAGRVAIPGAKWETSVAAAAVGIVRINS